MVTPDELLATSTSDVNNAPPFTGVGPEDEELPPFLQPIEEAIRIRARTVGATMRRYGVAGRKGVTWFIRLLFVELKVPPVLLSFRATI